MSILPYELMDRLMAADGPMLIHFTEFNPDPHKGDLFAVYLSNSPDKWYEVTDVGANYYIVHPTDKRPPTI